ncbi:FadR family transcriptional regulator [Verticiella sediminum]|uniref:FadR family transcriptional regulator n=1 Tax=Verticiella sediminum TaxID=1247510 RepID=A0A556ABF7_9BURK|nr:FadR/GntR family transcriptional regulator [Verticiella sediminum]TSH90201.1 FadR family transcriptional regulator [Verticiella sediminum]
MQDKSDRLKRASLADELASELRGRLLAGTYAPGERLPTGSELSASFGVSMSVVREALSRLKHEGLVRIVQGAGAFATDTFLSPAFRLDDDDDHLHRLIRVFELRQAVESEAARLAAIRRTDLQLESLRSALHVMARAVASEKDGTFADAHFHQLLAQATGNPLFIELYTFLAQHIDAAIETARMHSMLRGTWRDAHDEHVRIFEAIEAREPEAARKAIQAHIRNAAKRLGLPLLEATSEAS